VDRLKSIGYDLDKQPVNYFNAYSEALPFADSFFDSVISVNAMDHVANFERTIYEIARVLRSEGEFICTINYRSTPTITEPEVIDDNRVLKAISGLLEANKGTVYTNDGNENDGVNERVLWKMRRI
jgi:ubiquinone/menaquinone biosynthesis C-methylase UbiE